MTIWLRDRDWVRWMGRGTFRLLLIVLVPARGRAIDARQTLTQLHHTSWTADDGAPTDVNDIAQTDEGFLWFGTVDGLVRFDGVQFERHVPASGETLP